MVPVERTSNFLAKIIEVKMMENNKKYLKNPLILNKRESTDFEDLVQKIKNKINT